MPVGTYKVTVRVGNLVSECSMAGKCKLEVKNDYTPYLHYIKPVSVIPWSVIDINGYF